MRTKENMLFERWRASLPDVEQAVFVADAFPTPKRVSPQIWSTMGSSTQFARFLVGANGRTPSRAPRWPAQEDKGSETS